MTTIPNPNTITALTLQSMHSSYYKSYTFEGFSEILSRAPQLAPHVRLLLLQFLPGHSSSPEAAAALTAILAKLNSTNTLSVQMEAGGDEFQWSSLSLGVQAALQTALLRPTLTSLRLSRVQFDGPVEFISVLAQASQLHELIISQVTLKNAGDGNTTLPSMRLSLHTLKVDCYMTTPQLLRLLTRVIDGSQLRHLLTFITPDLEPAACEVLAIAVNVEHYHVRLEEYGSASQSYRVLSWASTDHDIHQEEMRNAWRSICGPFATSTRSRSHSTSTSHHSQVIPSGVQNGSSKAPAPMPLALTRAMTRMKTRKTTMTQTKTKPRTSTRTNTNPAGETNATVS